MDMLTQGLPPLITLLVLIGLVRAIVLNVRFDSEDVLQVRDPSGTERELRLSAWRRARAQGRSRPRRRASS